MTGYNFGFAGQPQANPYDQFLCLSQRCKQKRDEKKELRNEKKELKNDERRAETERIRAETKALQEATTVPTQPTIVNAALPDPNPAATASTAGTNPLLFIGIGVGVLLLVGGAIYFLRRNKDGEAISEPLNLTTT